MNEKEIINKIKNGDKKLLETFLNNNKNLVRKIANKYKYEGIDNEDLFQEGCIGFMKAIEKYEPNLGFKFSTYCYYYIRAYITKYIRKNKSVIRKPDSLYESQTKIFNFIDNYLKATGEKPNNDMIAKELDMSIELVENALKYSTSILSLNKKISDEDETEFGDLIENKTDIFDDVNNNYMKTELHGRLMKSNLSQKEKIVLFVRYGLLDGEYKTLEKTSTYIGGVTRERVRQIELKALKKLRNSALDNKVFQLVNDNEAIQSDDEKSTKIITESIYNYLMNKFFPRCTINDVDTMLTKLNKNEIILLHKIFGDDLAKPTNQHIPIYMYELYNNLKLKMSDILRTVINDRLLKLNNLALDQNINEKKCPIQIKQILSLKFGNNVDREYTNKEIADLVGVDISVVNEACYRYRKDDKKILKK